MPAKDIKDETSEVEEKKMTEKETEQEEQEEQETQESEETEKKKERKKNERVGIAYILGSPNNTIVHITDLAGNTISRITGGMVTKHSRLKANPTIAMFVAKRAAERAVDLGFTKVYVRMRGRSHERGSGPGAHAAVKSLTKAGLNVISILDASRIPRGGPKKKGGRRGRRV